MPERAFGVSIDGTRVTVVETLGDIAVSSNSVDAGSLEDSLTVALEGIRQKRKDPAIRVAMLAPSVSMRRIDATASLAASRADFEDAVFAALPVNREVTAVAGAFFDPDALVGDAVSAGVAVVGPADRVEEVYRLVGKRRIELVASPLLLAGFDGVWLGLHDGVADVTLVVDGRPLAYRQLRAGGLNALLSVLGDPADASLGRSRVRGALAGTASDPIADVELGRYLRMVAGELAQTVDYWRKTGEPVPGNSEVLVYGSGASSPAERAVTEAGFKVVMPDLLLQALSYVPPAGRGESLLALCAAATAGRYMPQASFTNPLFAALLESRRRVRRRLTVAAGAIVAAAFVGLALVRPFVDGWLSSRRAESDLAAARSEFEGKASWYYKKVDLEARRAVVEAADSSEPAWEDVYRVVFGSVPPSAVISQVVSTASGTSVVVTVSVSHPGGNSDDLAAWLVALDAVDGVSDVWTSGFAVREDGAATYDVSLRMDLAPGAVPVVIDPSAASVDVAPSVPAPVAAPVVVPTTVPAPIVPDADAPTPPVTTVPPSTNVPGEVAP